MLFRWFFPYFRPKWRPTQQIFLFPDNKKICFAEFRIIPQFLSTNQSTGQYAFLAYTFSFSQRIADRHQNCLFHLCITNTNYHGFSQQTNNHRSIYWFYKWFTNSPLKQNGYSQAMLRDLQLFQPRVVWQREVIYLIGTARPFLACLLTFNYLESMSHDTLKHKIV